MQILKKLPNHIKVAMSAWISRVGIAIIQIFTIRTLISYLGEEKYAVYVILYSLLAWCNLAECGIGFSLQNFISESRAKNKDYHIYLKTAFQLIICIFIISLFLIAIISSPLQNFLLAKYLHIQEISTINIVLIITFIFLILTFVNISIKILYAMQKGIIPNILQLVSYIFSAIFILLLNRYSNNNKSILLALLCFCLPQVLIMLIPFIKIFKTKLKDLLTIDKEIFKQFAIRAIKFAGIAFMSACVLQIDYIIMAKTLTSISIVSYNIFTKVFFFIFFIYSSILTAFWPTSNELFNTGNYLKLKNLLKAYTCLGSILMIFGIMCVFLFQDIIIKILSPNVNIKLTISFFILCTIYYIVRCISDTYTTFLQSINILKIYWIFIPIHALLNIIFQYYLSLKYGLNGIILGLILAYCFTALWIPVYKAYKVFKNVENK